jgi:hypothetical protein
MRMEFVRNAAGAAYILQARVSPPAGSVSMIFVGRPTARKPKERTVQDLLYIGLTIVVFAVLFLIVKGVERFER